MKWNIDTDSLMLLHTKTITSKKYITRQLPITAKVLFKGKIYLPESGRTN